MVAHSPTEGAWEDMPGSHTLFVEGGHLVLAVAAVGELRADVDLDDGRWHHVAVSVAVDGNGDNEVVQLYADGEPLERGNRDDWNFQPAEAPRGDIKIGFAGSGFPGGLNPFFGGILDDVTLWQTALSGGDIRTDFENPGASCGGCATCEAFLRGDVNADGDRNIADAINLLGHLFGGQSVPSCPDAADANDDGGLDIADAIKILGHLFGGDGPLADPFGACGADPSADDLEQCVYPPCD